MIAYVGLGFCLLMLVLYKGAHSGYETRARLASSEQERWAFEVCKIVADGKLLLLALGALHFAHLIWG